MIIPAISKEIFIINSRIVSISGSKNFLINLNNLKFESLNTIATKRSTSTIKVKNHPLTESHPISQNAVID
jgi:hypothetical protein